MINARRFEFSRNWWGLNGKEQCESPSEVLPLTRGLISAMANKTTMPEATPELIRLAKEHLAHGISVGDTLYEVMVFVPDGVENRRAFFVLVPVYPGGELKRLREL